MRLRHASRAVTFAALVLAAVTPALRAPAARAAAAEIGRLVAPKPAAVAVDAGLSKMFVAGQDGVLRVYDTRTYASTDVSLTCCLSAVVADPATHRVFVSGNGLIVLDGIAGVVLATLSLAPGAPDALALDSAGGRVFVADPVGNRVAVVDAATATLTRSIPTAARPVALAYDAATDRLFVAAAGADIVQAIDAATGSVLASAAVATPQGIALGAGEVYVSTASGVVRVLDAATLAAVRTIGVGSSPRGLAVDPTTHRLWVADWGSGTVSFVDTASGTVLGTMPSGSHPTMVALDAALGRAYVPLHGAGEVQLLHDIASAPVIVTPPPGATIGPAARFVTGTAPPGAPVTIFEDGNAVGGGLARSDGGFSINVALSEGAHTVLAAVPYEPYSQPRTFTVDLTPPSIALVERTPPNASGWNTAPVHLVWSCADALAGVKAASVEKLLAFDGRAQTSTGTCEDRAGNKTSLTVAGIDIDQRPPTVALTHTPAAFGGWNRTSPVTVSFTCVDTLSGVVAPSTFSQQVAGETAGQTVTFTCRDVAGNVAARADTIRIDTVAPVATLDAGQPTIQLGLSERLVGMLPLGIRGSATDALSGPYLIEARFVDEQGTTTIVPATCIADCGARTIKWRVRPPAALPSGIYQVSVRASDLALNVGAWSAPAGFAIVAADPPIPFLPNLPLPG